MTVKIDLIFIHKMLFKLLFFFHNEYYLIIIIFFNPRQLLFDNNSFKEKNNTRETINRIFYLKKKIFVLETN